MKPVEVQEIMTREVLAVAPDTGLDSAARLMVNRRVSGLPVVEEDGRPVGVIALIDLADPDNRPNESDGDGPSCSAYYTVTDGVSVPTGGAIAAGEGCVSDRMTPFVFSVESTADVTEAAAQMIEYNIHRLLVMDGEKLVGIISSLDLVRGLMAKL